MDIVCFAPIGLIQFFWADRTIDLFLAHRGCLPQPRMPGRNVAIHNFRYCMTLVNGDSVPVGKDGHPITPNKGLIAIQQRGIWRPLCVDRWDNVSLTFTAAYSSSQLFHCAPFSHSRKKRDTSDGFHKYWVFVKGCIINWQSGLPLGLFLETFLLRSCKSRRSLI